MTSKNWLKIDTSVLEGDVWSKKFSKVEAYIYLVKSARWQKNEEEKFGIKFGTGQLVTSFRELSSIWGWKYSSVRRFCDSLKSQGIIEIFDCGRASCITITNMKCETTVEHKWLTSGSPNESLNGSPKTQNNNELNNVCESLNGSLNGSQVNHPSDSSRAQVILNLFDNNVDNNKQDNIVEVDNPLNPPKGKPKGYEKFDFSFVDEKFYDVFVKWLDYKRDGGGKKFLYKTQKTLETCYDGIVKTSKGIPEAAMDILTYCITSSYQGYFAPRGFWWEWGQKKKKDVTNEKGEVMVVHPDWKYVGEDGRHYETMYDMARHQNSYEEYFQLYGNYVSPK